MGITTSRASPAKATSRPILKVVIIRSLLDFLLAALAPRYPCKDIRVGEEAGSTEHGNGYHSVDLVSSLTPNFGEHFFQELR